MPEQTRRRFLSWRLIGPVVVAAAILYAGPATIWRVVSGAKLEFVAVALSLAIPLALVKGLRWKHLLESQGAKIGLGESTSMYALGMVMAAITPGRMGEAIKILPLRARGHSLGQAIALIVLDRLLDLGFVMFAGYLGMLYFFRYVGFGGIAIPLGGLVILVLGIILLARVQVLKSVIGVLIPRQHRLVIRECWSEIVDGLRGSSILTSIELVSATVASWLIWFLAVYLCAIGIGIDVSFLYLCACMAVATVVSFLPITIAGAGTRDATFILLLGPLGIPRTEVLAFSSLVLAVFVLNSVIFYAMAVLLRPRSRNTRPAPTWNPKPTAQPD